MKPSLDDDAAGLAQILAAVPGFVILVDRDRRIQYINRVEPGYDRAQVLGMPADAFLFPGSQPVFEAALASVLATGSAEAFEVGTSSADGSTTWYRSQMFPYRIGTAIVGAVVMATNITELKTAQATVAKLRQLLPLCAWCGKIRNQEGSWETVERYLGARMNTQVTHGICPECSERQLDGGMGEQTGHVA